MRKLWLVARFEYLTRIKERSFLISTASVPLVLLVAIVVGHAVDRFSDDDMTTIGYVDRASIISERAVEAQQVDGELSLRAYADEDTARADLDGGIVAAYYVVPAEYPASGDIELFALTELPKSSQRSAFVRVVRSSLLADQPAQVRERILEGSSTVARLANSQREVSEDNPMAFLVSMFGAIMLSFCIMTSGMQMLHAISTEKENRVIEVLFLSLSPRQMIGGKALGLIALFVTQLTVWIASLVVAALAAQPAHRQPRPSLAALEHDPGSSRILLADLCAGSKHYDRHRQHDGRSAPGSAATRHHQPALSATGVRRVGSSPEPPTTSR